MTYNQFRIASNQFFILYRRIEENRRLAWLQQAEIESLTPADRAEWELKKDWRVWTERELRDFIKI